MSWCHLYTSKFHGINILSEQINPYEILGVSPTASNEELKDSYKKLVKTLHPDLNPGSDSSEMYQNVIEAYETVGHPDRRANYDLLHPELFKNERNKSSGRLSAVKIKSSGTLSAITEEDLNKVSLTCTQKNANKWMQLKHEVGTNLKAPEKPIEVESPIKYFLKSIKGIFKKVEKKETFDDDGEPEEIIAFGGQPEKKRVYYFTITPFEAEKGTYRELAIKFNEIQKKLKIKIPAHTKDKTVLRIKNPYSHDKIEIVIKVAELES